MTLERTNVPHGPGTCEAEVVHVLRPRALSRLPVLHPDRLMMMFATWRENKAQGQGGEIHRRTTTVSVRPLVWSSVVLRVLATVCTV